MEKFTINSRSVILSISVPVDIGFIKCNGIVQIEFDNVDEYVYDVIDFVDLHYMGKLKSYKDFKEIREFHLKNHINLVEMIEAEIKKVLTEETIIKILKENI